MTPKKIDWLKLAAESYDVGVAAARKINRDFRDDGWANANPARRTGFIAAIKYAVEQAKKGDACAS